MAASVVPIADADAELSYAVSITLMHYATQKDIYSEGENQIPKNIKKQINSKS